MLQILKNEGLQILENLLKSEIVNKCEISISPKWNLKNLLYDFSSNNS